MIRISVVTVCLNAEKVIGRCLDSVLTQTYKNLEYLVVDGGSTDGSLELIHRVRNKIDYFVSEPDRGLYHAMNKGIQAATGEFVYFLNTDDYFCDAEVVADVARAIEDNPGVDLLYGDVLMHDGLQWIQKPPLPILNRETLCRKGFCHQALFAGRKVLLETGGFSEDYRIVADADWLARALSCGATSLYLKRDIAKISLDGLSSRTRWRDEKKRYLRANYTPWERFLWRKLPGILGRK
ncbi:glycosyltransferase family 2 protein [Geoalkalibacter sp.]|uniref:glycosyltransferase family 2 protein n=1 Tax=Geoalkalibacter sp. TaxID=3041440 RepID=UPI00272E934F|nr:glycosyltransferase family 2 protein [Geoalkalibacter sp.]